MSVCINFRSRKQIEPKQIFDELVNRAKKIMITSDKWPCVKLGSIQESLRGIEINREENGYEVRICSFANRADLQLYSSVVDVMRSLTKAKALYEDDEENEIANPLEELGDDWIIEQLESSLRVNCALIRHYGKPVIMDGMFFPFCIGPSLAKVIGIDLSDPYDEMIHEVQDYLVDLQWHYANKENTSTRLALRNPAGEDERPLSISLIYAEKGKVKPFDFVSYADVFCLMDKDGDTVMIPMEDFHKIVSPKDFTFMDDYQLAAKGNLSYESFKQMQNMARLYEVEDLFFHPTFPGNGYEEKQNTFVLMWNPAISNVKIDNHADEIPYILTGRFSWSVYDYEQAKKGDRFVMVRCGEGRTGIVMSGVFDSNPYQDKDWNGKGRRVFYMQMTPNFIADPERLEDFITTEELQKAIPTFEWNGGHSGRILTVEQAKQLENLLASYLVRFCNNVDGEVVNGYSLPQSTDI